MSNTDKVLLKRNFRTPMGRFDKSRQGIPTEIPKKVIMVFGLPKDAEIVDDDYVPPAAVDHELKSLEESAAKQEEEINKRVDQVLEQRRKQREQQAKEQAKKKEDEADPFPEFLKTSVAGVQAALENHDIAPADLREYLEAEVNMGMNRKGVVIALQAALEDFND